MTKWYCELSESYHDTPEEARNICCEFMEESDYIEHLYSIESGRLFKALTDPRLAEEIFLEIIDTAESRFFDYHVYEVESEDEEDEEDESI